MQIQPHLQTRGRPAAHCTAVCNFGLRNVKCKAADCAVAATRSLDYRLRNWIQEQGGFIHPSIALSDNTPCGSRGVVATADVSLGQLEQSPLISVPRHLQLDNTYAEAWLQHKLTKTPAADIQHLNQLQQVALVLAAEKQRGAESFWDPYISCLPEQPPNPWLMPTQQSVETAVDFVQGQQHKEVSVVAGWSAAVQTARLTYEELADEAMVVCGKDLGISHKELMWALGQVVSRSLGSGNEAGLVPYIDLINHSEQARPPMLMLDDDDKLVFQVTSIIGMEVRPMVAGDELYILYGGGYTPLEAFLKFGFVPAETWNQDLSSNCDLRRTARNSHL